MDEDLLRSFVAVCDTGSITAAAAVVHRSQPALSRRIAQLEAEVGAPLFDRVAGGMRTSAAGEAFRPFAHAAVAAIEDGRRAVRSLHREDLGPVDVALVGTLANTWLTAVLRDFAARHPAVEVRLRTANSHEVTDLVSRGDATLGLGYGRREDAALTCSVLFDERLVVACAPDHPRAGVAVGGLTDLRDEQWFAFPDRRPRTETNARYIGALLATAQVPEEHVRLVDSLTAQKRLVEAGFGLALLPESNVADERASGTLATIDVHQQGMSAEVVLTTRTHGYLSHAARSLLEALRAHRPLGPGRGSS